MKPKQRQYDESLNGCIHMQTTLMGVLWDMAVGVAWTIATWGTEFD